MLKWPNMKFIHMSVLFSFFQTLTFLYAASAIQFYASNLPEDTKRLVLTGSLANLALSYSFISFVSLMKKPISFAAVFYHRLTFMYVYFTYYLFH